MREAIVVRGKYDEGGKSDVGGKWDQGGMSDVGGKWDEERSDIEAEGEGDFCSSSRLDFISKG